MTHRTSEMGGPARRRERGQRSGVAARQLVLAALVGSLCWSWAADGARAQPADTEAPAAAEDTRYRQLVSEALSEYQLKHWTEARTLMTAAHEMEPSARTLRGLAMIAFEMRNYGDAAELIQQALEDGRKPLSASQREEAIQLLERARRYLGYYRVQVPPPWEGARVVVDGRPPRLDPEGRVILVVGEHTLQVRAEGALPFTRRVDVRGGEQGAIVAEFEPTKPEDAPTSQPEQAQQGNSAAGQADERAHRKQALSRGLGIGGGALLAAGSVMGGFALKASADGPERGSPVADRAMALSWATNVTLGVGIAAAAAGLITWLYKSESESEAHARLRPVVSPQVTRDTYGVSLSGEF